MMSIRQAWMLASLVFSASLWGQDTFTLSGTVSDTNGEVLPGAAVLVEESAFGCHSGCPRAIPNRIPKPWTLDLKASFVGHTPETWTLTFDKTTATKISGWSREPT